VNILKEIFEFDKLRYRK